MIVVYWLLVRLFVNFQYLLLWESEACTETVFLFDLSPSADSFLAVAQTTRNPLDLLDLRRDFKRCPWLCQPQLPHKRLYVVCSSVSVLFQLLQAQLNALLCLLPAKSPPLCQHAWDSTGTLAQSALSLGSHRLLPVLPIHLSSLCGHRTSGSVVCCFSVCDIPSIA